MMLNHEQIDEIIKWMNTWEQLKDTVIPIRFKEKFYNPLEKNEHGMYKHVLPKNNTMSTISQIKAELQRDINAMVKAFHEAHPDLKVVDITSETVDVFCGELQTFIPVIEIR